MGHYCYVACMDCISCITCCIGRCTAVSRFFRSINVKRNVFETLPFWVEDIFLKENPSMINETAREVHELHCTVVATAWGRPSYISCTCASYLGYLRSVVESQKLHDEGLSFVRTYKALAMINIRNSKHMFLMKPKLHVLWLQHKF